MALRDYAELDEDDFYGQDFEQSGIVSLWVGLGIPNSNQEEIDILQDCCGVGYYSLDNQESNFESFELVPFPNLIAELSYVRSFDNEAMAAALRAGISNARFVIAQFDFKFDPKRIKRQVNDDPRFLGSFRYLRNE